MRGGAARVTIPRGGSRREAEAFLKAHGDWLARQRARMREAARPAPDASLRALATRELPTRVRELADRLALSPARVIVRDQQSRWGSCSPSGTISLNWRLVQMPARVAEYVIVHELMHLQQPNHSRRFWRLVRRACPWADEARAWLRRHGPDLL